jgi:hypothetical protein
MCETSASVLKTNSAYMLTNIFMSLGQYQIRQAKAYIKEHLTSSLLDEDELEFIVEQCDDHPDLVRARFASRHSSSKTYMTTVQFDNDSDDEPVTGWFCTCCAGSRVIGCCAHITALIWQLGVYGGEVNTTTNDLNSARFFDFVRDAAEVNASDSTDNDRSSSDDDGADGED